MSRTLLPAVLTLLLPCAAFASGYTSPAHSNLDYAFTCAGGASGHATYVQDFARQANGPPLRDRQFRLWVNGAYLQDEPELAPLLQERTVQAVSALCDGGPTIIVIETWHPASSEKASVSIHVDDAGKLLAAGSKVVPSGL